MLIFKTSTGFLISALFFYQKHNKSRVLIYGLRRKQGGW